MAGYVAPRKEILPGQTAPVAPPNIFDAYGGAIKQTGSDYDEMMNNYRKVISNGPTSSPLSSPVNANPISTAYNSTSFTPTNTPAPTTFNPTKTPIQAQFSPTNISSSSQNNPSSFSPTNATTTNYKQSGDVTSGLAGLKSLADTGGYSPTDIQNLRERGISPIRSIYSNAQADVARQKSLQGGYSPNSAAVSAKMAREMSGQIGKATTDVNAGLAEAITRNKLTAAPQFASAAADESARRTAADQRNTDILNDTTKFNTTGKTQNDQFNASLASQIAQANNSGQNETNRINASGQNAVNLANSQGQNENDRFNTSLASQIAQANAAGMNANDRANNENRMKVDQINADATTRVGQQNFENKFKTDTYNNDLQAQDQARKMEAMKAMTSLYGTTPALANTFGNQALDQQKIDEQKRQFDVDQKNKNSRTLIDAYGRRNG